jgi:hypothetical protein
VDPFLLGVRVHAPTFFEICTRTVARVLPGNVSVTGIEEDALVAAGVIHHAGRPFAAIRNVYQEGPHGVRSVIGAESESHREKVVTAAGE